MVTLVQRDEENFGRVVHLLFLFICRNFKAFLLKISYFYFMYQLFYFLLPYFSRLLKSCQGKIQRNNKKAPELPKLFQA